MAFYPCNSDNTPVRNFLKVRVRAYTGTPNLWATGDSYVPGTGNWYPSRGVTASADITINLETRQASSTSASNSFSNGGSGATAINKCTNHPMPDDDHRNFYISQEFWSDVTVLQIG